ncbi:MULTISPECIES: LppX_LprAFG lipoprotein [Actinomadura]|uniref:LppX_LprAFG lipoprotein n=1 Tax=Actinomadura yumaensis TaxID=111807 RepID=A0ABW2CHE4_9ACTN|nr:LppX_LprAFG lipoprotein [Actinomadura sp. J1-007]MWK35888.1 LppX_LprAFG lipoprotein [Actinomadura sp. J1-007]
MNRRFAVAAGGTAVGAALLLSGCGGDGSSGTTTENMKLSAGEALLKSSQKTGQADTFKADLTVNDTGDGGGSVHATGQFRLSPELSFSAKLDDFARGGQSVPAVKGQAIFKDDVLYARVPQLAQFVAGGKPWLKIDVNQMSQRTGFDVKGLIDQVQRVNPAEQTKMFTGSKDARRVGEETVDGVKTIHYTGTVTVQDALNRLDAQARQKVSTWFPSGAANEKISFDLWTDGDNLPRKLVSKGTAKNGQSGTVQVLYSDYGKSFGVNPPPSDQVGNLSLGGFLGGGSTPHN